MVAIILANKKDFTGCELITSVEPCAMCLGASDWSRFSRIVCGARDEDAREIGFCEGEKPADWQQKFRAKGIEIVEDILRAESVEILKIYKKNGGEIY